MVTVVATEQGLVLGMSLVGKTKNFAKYEVPEDSAFIGRLYQPLTSIDGEPPAVGQFLLMPGDEDAPEAIRLEQAKTTRNFVRFEVPEASGWLGNIYFPFTHIDGNAPESILLKPVGEVS